MKKQAHQPICPKCGYDQSGEIATWESQCPVQGICPECGLEFTWTEVFHPLIHDLSWYIEHARSIRSSLWRTPGTLCRLGIPHVYWRSLNVKKRVSLFMLSVWCVLVCIGSHMLVAVAVGLEQWQESNWTAQPLARYLNQNGVSGALAIYLNGLIQPLYEVTPNVRGYSRFIDLGFRKEWWSTESLMDAFFRPVGFQIGFIMLWMLVLLAIPQTRKLTKLRGVHIARALILSLTAMVFTFELFRLNEALHGLGGYRTGITSYLYRLIVPMMIVWQIVFGGSAIAIGWRIRPWKLLVALGTLAGLLGGAALRVYVFLSTTA